MSNLPSKKYKKKNPTIRRLCFEGTGNATKYVDIAYALSILNRRAYRSGVYYYVNSVELLNNSDSGMDLYTVPDSYVARNAWKRGFAMFQKMNALVDTPRPKYHDFKVRMRSDHTLALTLDPDTYDKSSGGATQNHSHTADEWEYSQYTTMLAPVGSPQVGGSADSFTAHMIGAHVSSGNGNWASVGLIKSYGDTRPEPDQSGVPILPASHDTDILNNLFDASNDAALADIRQNLDDHNDETPYNADYYIGEGSDDMQHVARLATVATSNRVSKASGFCVPFGLICVDPLNVASDDNWTLIINLAEGTYNGVYAERV